jgi:osmotically-inducible protein OsmY
VAGVKALTTELKVHLTGLSKRTDTDVAAAVENVLEWTSSLPAGAIKVMVEGGWVTLSGDVDWQYQRQAATDGVRYLMGVTGISDQIGIKPSLTATAVKSDIEAALKRTSIEDAKKISVAVHGSDITLSGSGQSWAERDTATNSAWGTPGVRNVVDMMTLAYGGLPSPTDSEPPGPGRSPRSGAWISAYLATWPLRRSRLNGQAKPDLVAAQEPRRERSVVA